MIRLLTDDKINDFSVFCDKRLPGAVIFTRLLTYGLNSDEALFWYGENDECTINGVFSLSDGIFLACISDDTDKEEIELFAKTVGASTVTYGIAEYTLRYIGNDKNFTAEDISGENIKYAFDVIFENDKNRKLYFEKWYTDASHKIRHGLIHGKCIYSDGKCVSVALTSGETESIAVISSVATLSEYRHNGFGERVVLSLAQSLKKEVFLMTDNGTTKCWYEKIGFEQTKKVFSV